MSRYCVLTLAVILALAVTGYAEAFSESFDSGYTAGTNISTYAPMWYGDGLTNSPTLQAGQGVADSMGLSAAKNCFNWSGHTFTWTDPTLTGVVIGMDFKTPVSTDANFPFSDDRLGWTTSTGSSSTGYLFAVQLDKNGTGGCNITGYYKSSPTGSTRDDQIAAGTTVLSELSWYRLRATFTKLTNTSARIDVSLQELDANGVPGNVVVSGSVADSSVESGDWTHTPPAALFTAPTMCPSFKNYDQKAAGQADNAYFEVVRNIPDCAAVVSPEVDQYSVAEAGQPANPSVIDYSFSNVGAQAITYTVAELDAAQQPVDLPWLSLSKYGDTVASQSVDGLTATISTAGLAGGRYTGYLKFTDSCSPAVGYLRKIDLDVFACHWTVDSCSQERLYMLDYPTVLPPDATYRISNTGSTSMNYAVTKSGDSTCFDWLTLANATGTIAPGASADVVAHIDTQALLGHDTGDTYACSLTFTDQCSPQVMTRTVKVRYFGLGETQTFAYQGDVPPTDEDSAGAGYRFTLYDDAENGAVEVDPQADDFKVWRMADNGGLLKSWYRAYYRQPSGAWDRVHATGEGGSTMLARVKLNSWSSPDGSRKGIIQIGDTHVCTAAYHWGGTDGMALESKRDLGAQTGAGTNGFVVLRMTVSGTDEAEYDCGRTVRFYLNENPTPVLELLNAESKTTTTDRGFLFGDSTGSSSIDVSFDWITGTNAGAYAPGEEVAALGRSLIPVSYACHIPFADADEDHDVDQADFAVFQRCLAADSSAFDPTDCRCLDRDADQQIDETDFLAFHACALGPGVTVDVQNPPPYCVP